MAHQAVCISHSTGAGGEAVGRAVAERLGFRYADDAVLAEAAEWAELDPALIADAERRKPLVSRLLGHVADQESSVRLSSGEWARVLPNDADLRTLITTTIRKFADRGSVVIVAHAASFALAGHNILRVFVTASDETRTQRMAAATGIDERGAAKLIRESDRSRADYLKRFYAIDRELPIHFDVVINTDVLVPEKAADVIALAAS